MSDREVVSDERTEGIRSRNVRWTWLFMNYALAADIIYRGGFLGQNLSQFIDVFAIWGGGNLLYVVLDLVTGALTPAAFRLSALPVLILGLLVGGAVGVITAGTGPWIGVVAGFALAFLIVVGFLFLRRRRSPR